MLVISFLSHPPASAWFTEAMESRLLFSRVLRPPRDVAPSVIWDASSFASLRLPMWILIQDFYLEMFQVLQTEQRLHCLNQCYFSKLILFIWLRMLWSLCKMRLLFSSKVSVLTIEMCFWILLQTIGNLLATSTMVTI